jgi:hypothetical protein
VAVEARPWNGPVQDFERFDAVILRSNWDYARIDGVDTRKGFRVMEVEVNEPGLFFDLAPAAAETFADAVCRRLSG